MKSPGGYYNGSAITRKLMRPPRPKASSITSLRRMSSALATTPRMTPKTKTNWLISNRPLDMPLTNRTRPWTHPKTTAAATSSMAPSVIQGASGNWSESALDSGSEDDRGIEPYTVASTILTSIPVAVIIFIIVAGNALIIAAVLRDSRLKRQVQNWLIVSLAVADLLVGLLIMPLTLSYELLDQWVLGDVLCELWLALDVLFVTASILNLCAISLDRYWSLTDPMRYPQKRTSRRMLAMIVIVWLSAFAISFPPLVGWRPENRAASACFLSDQLGYVLYSALGSFFIPVLVLLFVYARIYCITRRRSKKKPASRPFFSSRTVGATTPLKAAAPPIVIEAQETTIGASTRVIGNSDSSGSNEIAEAAPAVNFTSGANGVTSRTSEFMFTENDYAVLIAKIRSMAMNDRDGSIISDSGTIVSSSWSPMRQPDRALSIVTSIANEALTQSRAQKREEDPLAAKALDLKKQLMQRQKLVRRRERQATLVLGLVLGAFIGSWMPFFCSYVLSAMGLRTPDLLFDLVFWLGYCNSGLNPFIYNFFNPDFRRAFRRILRSPAEKLRAALCGLDTLNSAGRRRSSASCKARKTVLAQRYTTRRGAVFSPRHPYLQVQQQHYQQQVPALVSPFDNAE